MVKPMSAHRKSAVEIVDASKKIRRATDATWALAPKCPMFTRKSDPNKKIFRTDPNTGKKKEIKVVRTNRLISGHAYKVAASGAAYAVYSTLKHEADRLRLPIGKESKKVPWSPSYSKGAMALIEQFLCAYGQEAFWNAVQIRKGLGTHKRVTHKMVKMGFERARESVFASSIPGARAVFVSPPPIKKKKGAATKPEEDEEFRSDEENAIDGAQETA